MNKKLICGLVTALTLSPVLSPALAPVMAEEIDEIVVSATGIPTPLAQIGASVDIITAQDLERQQITYLQDALKLKGINIGQNGGPGTLSNVFLRGLPGKYTDLVVDGISFYDPRSEQVLWQDVIADGIGRVEILRGSQGVMFGSNTIAGVVSQFTKTGGDTEGRLRLEAGELGSHKISVSGNGQSGHFDYGYAVSNASTDGFSAVSDTKGDKDGYKNTTLHGVAHAYFSDDLTLDIVVRGTSGESDFDDFSNQPPYGPSDAKGRGEEFSRHATRIALHYQQGNIVHSLSLNNYEAEIDSITNYVKTAGDDSSRSQVNYKATVSAENIDMVVGLEETEIARQISGTDYESDNTALSFLVATKTRDALNMTLGVRQDDHQYFGTHATYRATLAYVLQDAVMFRAAHGTGFRAPTLFNLYSTYGNELLQPETSKSSEVGADIRVSDDTALSFTAYQINIEDLIDYVSTSTPPFGEYRQVSGTTRSKGFEANIAHALNRHIKLNAAAVYADSRVPDTGSRTKRQVRVPRLKADFGISYAVNDKLNVSADFNHVKSVVDGGVELKDYTLFNLRGSYQLSDTLQAYARLENATDKDYEVISGYSTSGQAAYIGVTSSF